MKKLILSTLLLSFYGVAQEQTPHASFVESSTNTNFYKTPPLRSFIGTSNEVDEQMFIDAIAKDGKNSVDGLTDIGIPENGGIDPAIQTTEPLYKGTQETKANFSGLGGGFPPDPSGAAGPDHYIQAVNTSYRIFDKDGSPVSGSLHSLSFLWPGSSSDGDPIVMYDRYAERWFISQFQTGTNQILIAISETSDPMGSYYSYTFTPGGGFPDYPKFGIWEDGYYMSANSSSRNCVVFEREKMLLGNTAQMVTMTFPSMGYWFRSVAPAYAEGQTAPAEDEPFYYFHIQDNAWSGVSSDHIKVLKCEVDWATTSNSSIVIHQTLPIAAVNTVFGSGSQSDWDNISQRGTNQKLDAVAGIFSYKAQFRVFDTYNTAVMCTTVDVNNNDRAGIRWYELREDHDDLGNWYIHQEGTYAPDNTNNRWLGNIAMDCFGNMALAYSFAGPNEYVGIRYTGRFKDDPLNQMTVQEQIAVEGLGAQTSANRFGDYSQMTMDPVDDYTFWFTGEYLGSGGSRKTRIFSFSSWHLLGQPDIKETQPFFNAYQPNPSAIKLVWNSLNDDNVSIEFYDMNGKIVLSEKATNLQGGKEFSASEFSRGIYLVKIKGENTNLTKKVYISKI